MGDRDYDEMTANEHRGEAMKWLREADRASKLPTFESERIALARAQVHATLAITAPSGPDGIDDEGWDDE